MPIPVGTSDISKLQFDSVRFMNYENVSASSRLENYLWFDETAHTEKENPSQAFPNQESTFKTFTWICLKGLNSKMHESLSVSLEQESWRRVEACQHTVWYAVKYQLKWLGWRSGRTDISHTLLHSSEDEGRRNYRTGICHLAQPFKTCILTSDLTILQNASVCLALWARFVILATQRPADCSWAEMLEKWSSSPRSISSSHPQPFCSSLLFLVPPDKHRSCCKFAAPWALVGRMRIVWEAPRPWRDLWYDFLPCCEQFRVSCLHSDTFPLSQAQHHHLSWHLQYDAELPCLAEK